MHDASAVGSFQVLKKWWDVLSTLGPMFGYHPKASKTVLVVHPKDEEAAKVVFQESDAERSVSNLKLKH